MHRNRGFGLHALLLAGLLFASTASTASAATSRQAQLDELVTRYHALKQFNGTVLVADEKGIVFQKPYGSANFEWQLPHTLDTRFRLGSITKQFTAMVVMQLVNEGKLKLNEKLVTYLPDYRKDTGSRVTLHQLLNHTSGIPSYTGLPGFFQNESRNPYTVAEFVKKFASGDLEFEPGTKFQYNNSGYFLLGAIIEKVEGKPYAQVVQERIFAPLGMKHSGYDLAAPLIPKRASGYVLKPEGYVNAPYLDMSIPYAAGSLYSTVGDLFLWDRALYGEKLLPAALKQKMFTPGLANYGYGWFIQDVTLADGKTKVATVSHTGGINGFNTLLLRVPERHELVVLLDNTSRGDKLEALGADLLGILHGVQPKGPRRSIGEVVSAAAARGSVAQAIAQYRSLKASQPNAYDFEEENALNGVGYSLLQQGRVPDAIEIFKLNVEMFPKNGNPYDSLGEAYLAAGNKELALKNYQRSLELDPKNSNAKSVIERLQRPESAKKSKYPLEAYVGSYALAPNFALKVTVEQGQLTAQGTGQPKFPLAADGDTAFAAVGVPARLVFAVDEAAHKATSLVLQQGGREMPAKRTE
ncbi:serine hydrolase [Aggregicoccus sp. 17bor-14]|uniref:serine hydrolase n=1 Tax=Myxococcaceae TaxID=31 RepID=UPI00129C58B1|nr:serine hydrolase [Simulacricoccus sp. 17bor-14]MRI87991.1 serine hydrolase [Aggregicoccus sp. 17bor-14]